MQNKFEYVRSSTGKSSGYTDYSYQNVREKGAEAREAIVRSDSHLLLNGDRCHSQRAFKNGKYGIVRFFVIDEHEIAVKSPLKYARLNYAENYARIFKIAYPELYIEVITWKDMDGKVIDWRLLMDVFPLTMANSFLYETEKSYQLKLHVLVAIAQELNRLHQLGIIHSDVHADNFSIEQLDEPDEYGLSIRAYSLDFELSRLVGEPIKTFPNNAAVLPERRCEQEKAPSAHPSQDIYDFAKLVQNFCITHKIISLDLYNCIMQSLSYNPLLRPASVEIFIPALLELVVISKTEWFHSIYFFLEECQCPHVVEVLIRSESGVRLILDALRFILGFSTLNKPIREPEKELFELVFSGNEYFFKALRVLDRLLSRFELAVAQQKTLNYITLEALRYPHLAEKSIDQAAQIRRFFDIHLEFSSLNNPEISDDAFLFEMIKQYRREPRGEIAKVFTLFDWNELPISAEHDCLLHLYKGKYMKLYKLFYTEPPGAYDAILHTIWDVFKVSYRAWLNAKTSLFSKTDELSPLLVGENEWDQFYHLLCYIEANPTSPLAKILKIINENKLDIWQAPAIESIHLEAFAESTYFTTTSLYGPTCYPSAAARRAAKTAPLTDEKIKSSLASHQGASDFQLTAILSTIGLYVAERGSVVTMSGERNEEMTALRASLPVFGGLSRV